MSLKDYSGIKIRPGHDQEHIDRVIAQDLGFLNFSGAGMGDHSITAACIKGHEQLGTDLSAIKAQFAASGASFSPADYTGSPTSVASTIQQLVSLLK